MKKIIIFLMLILLFFTLSSCKDNDENSDETELLEIAGTFSMTDAPKYIGDLYITEMAYELFINGKITCHIMGVPRMGGEVVNSNRYGRYVCKKGSGKINFTFSDSDSISVMDYYGNYVETIYSKFYLTGANSDGELAGDIIKLSYMVDGPGTISGARAQYLKNGSDATTVEAVPGLGAEFVEWSDGVKDKERKDSDITEDTTLTAKFRQVTPLVNVIYNADLHGTIVGYSNQTIVKGGTTASVTAETLYEGNWFFVRWSDGVKTATRTDTNVLEDFTVTAIFSRVYNLHYSTDYGNIIGEADQYLLDGEDGTPVTATTDQEFLYFERWSDGVTTATRQDMNVTQDISVTALFGAKNRVSYEVDENQRGYIEGSTSQWVKDGEDATAVTAVPNEGYVFVQWSDGVTTATRQDTNLQNQVNVYAIFRLSTVPNYTLTYIAGDNGSISGQASQTISKGEDGQSITAVPNEGYVFVQWSDGVTTATRQDMNVTQDISVTALFGAKNRVSYEVDENQRGYIEGSTSQWVKDGEDATAVTAVPNEGYVFVQWSDGVTTATRQDMNVTQDISVTALFGAKNRVSYEVDENQRGYIEGSTIQWVKDGEDATAVTAVPNEGYVFVQWSDGVTTATRQDMNVVSNIEVTALFVEIPENTVDFVGGKGTKSNPYKISTIEQLNNVINYPSSSFILINDIELPIVGEGESNFTPIFSDETSFQGSFDGNEKTISNLTIYNDETFYTGLFGYIGEEGSVNNLILRDMNITGANYIGGISGYSLGVITNCDVSGNIKHINVNNYKVYIGGIVGRTENCIDNNTSAGTIVFEDDTKEPYIGGITGYCEYNSVVGLDSSMLINSAGGCVGGLIGYGKSNVSNSYATGRIIISNTTPDSYYYIGGLIGNGGKAINSVYSTGDIEVSSNGYSFVGGLIGSGGENVSNAYATGNINVSNLYYANRYSYVGGLIGCGGNTVINSYATGNVSLSAPRDMEAYAGGLIGKGGGTLTHVYATGNINVSSEHYTFGGGLIGRGGTYISRSYATGNVTAITTSTNEYSAFGGGLIGYTEGSGTISNSYAIGIVFLSVAEGSHAYGGGLIGSGERLIYNSYSISVISVSGEGYLGGIIGYVSTKINLINTHWIKTAESEDNYAIGYCDSLGVPTNMGTTKHTDITDFYTLADTLNEGQEETVWENKDENSLPTLKVNEIEEE